MERNEDPLVRDQERQVEKKTQLDRGSQRSQSRHTKRNGSSKDHRRITDFCIFSAEDNTLI